MAEETGPEKEESKIDLTKPVEPDLGRLALVLTQLQAEFMTLGNQLGKLMGQVSMLDRASHQRLTLLEKTVMPEPQVPGGGPRPETPKIVTPSNAGAPSPRG